MSDQDSDATPGAIDLAQAMAARLAALLDHHAPRRSAIVRAQRAAQARHASRGTLTPANTTGGNP